jgi:type IV pilus assembly protein PilX
MFLSQQISPVQQRGAVLLVGLIMLLLLTVIGMASIRGTDLQERMAGNMRDRSLAFEAAETALRSGENTVSGLSGLALPDIDVAGGGYYQDLNKATSSTLTRPTVWTKAVWVASGKPLATGTLEGVSEQPRFVIEKVLATLSIKSQGSGVDVMSDQSAEGEYFRVTARGIGGSPDSEVVLQSTFVR